MKTHKLKLPLVLAIYAILLPALSACSHQPALTEKERALQSESLERFDKPTRWQKKIDQFKARDLESPPPADAVLFVGSSSIVRWDTKKWFPDIPTINRGFGGSHIVDSWYYAGSIIIPYHPRTIVFYAGDNDAAAGKPPQMILANFKALAIRLRKALPKTKIIYIAIKPSIKRWALWPEMQKANQRISDFCNEQKNMTFVDVSKVMLDDAGKPIAELFSSDGLHMNESGYERWTTLLRPLLK